MHLLLTDRLSCPRCGPAFGLILLSDRTEERRVLEGTLGCPNCRDAFPVREGLADLRAPPRGALPAGRVGAPPAEPDLEGGQRLAALLGLAGGPGAVVLVGAPARHAGYWGAESELQVVAVDPDLRSWPETEGVSRVVASPGLPLFSATLRGACVDGTLGPPWIEEACRVVARGGRVVVVDAPEGTPGVLRTAGLSVLLDEAGTVVAARG